MVLGLQSGARMYIGGNLAMYQIEFILAALYTNFTTPVDDEDVEQADGYIAPPSQEKMVIRLKRVQ
ncbi:hypothetical protein EDB81DRAFT_899452 [Dactylonectria macrodidyma]|uniref:Uncharacterized protein n=1 Tax=Dactylonectria macrodidyma TaxID=307937 RepID=A0A9P9EQW3_9HYPO|nr:hypothetical protein EDB81DRAFT_899452 [Dactylonectria macrodidyma]